MESLLDTVLKAHGGLPHWEKLKTLETEITYDGPFWGFKGQPDFAGVEKVTADLQQQRISSTNTATGRTVHYDKEQDTVTVTSSDGTVIETLTNPRSSFAGFGPDTQWTAAQTAYFRSYATWHYLVEPYLFTWPGVKTHEVAPWDENGETWRVLQVDFPASIDTHSKRQLYYFDQSARLRRMDYQPEINGSTPVAHYILEHTRVTASDVPTKRNIYLRNEDGTADLSWTPISLALCNTTLL